MHRQSVYRQSVHRQSVHRQQSKKLIKKPSFFEESIAKPTRPLDRKRSALGSLTRRVSEELIQVSELQNPINTYLPQLSSFKEEISDVCLIINLVLSYSILFLLDI